MKLAAILFSILLCVNSSFALSIYDMPDEFDITQRWVSFTSTYDIETETQKMGTLYRKFFSFLLTYEFLDPYNNKLATAQSRFFSLTATFDIYDNDNRFLGMAEEKLFSFFPTFDIYGSDAITKLAKAKLNFWGTNFSIYDPVTNEEMASLHRSFFRLKNNWTFSVINRPLLTSKNINPKVLLTVIAFQGDREFWMSQIRRLYSNSADKKTQLATSKHNRTMLDKINKLYQAAGFTDTDAPDANLLEKTADELEINYTDPSGSFAKQTNVDKANAFTDYCLNIAQANGIPDSKKKAILYLLKMRFASV